MKRRLALVCPATRVHVGEPIAHEAHCSCAISPPPIEPPRFLNTEAGAVCSLCGILLAAPLAKQGQGETGYRR